MGNCGRGLQSDESVAKWVGGEKEGKKTKTKQKQKPAGNDDDDDNPLRPTCAKKKSNRTKPQLNFSFLAKIM